MHWGGMFCGKVEEVAGQWIETDFVIIGIPLIPVRSVLCFRDQDLKVNRCTVRFHLRSMLAAYARWFLGLGGAGSGLLGIIFICEEHGSKPWFLLMPPALLAVAFVLSLTRMGRLSAEEVRKRQVLGQLTGYYVDPQMLLRRTVLHVLGQLRNKAEQDHLSTSPEHWQSHMPDPNSLRLLFALAAYEQQADPCGKWGRIASEFWTLLHGQDMTALQKE